ncbi:hypothetical protein TCAL_06009 [Tigriopus californicus]|uniref:EF-hand domain-containing protein n=1 Tax=Tigriopus californicus TaxID=6832 RepID=A0A553PQI2_TIGCA|nr:uncharacterized protein LOC131881626 [Tigriopus californicus]TRY79943.1 hypothetical protein TCAL_06009 [Tigriopus californicus]|eukprot:TCALIF_06009-PA protein Name:"Similar to CCM1 Calmodulin (Capsicum annuum)" AED:0.22 eAED:0.22 QI:25/1/1/1/1/1/3/51/146
MSELTDDQIDDMKDAFSMFKKKSNSDTINIKDLRAVMLSIGLNPKDEEIAQMEKEKEGEIDFPEFCALIREYQKQAINSKDELKEAFRVFDQQGKGYLTKEELETVMRNYKDGLSDKQFDLVMEKAQFDTEGHLSLDNFLKLIFNE